MGKERQEQIAVWEEAFQILRHGDSFLGFSGFNDDATTGWSTHAAKVKSACKMNADLTDQIKKDELDDEKKMQLQQQIVDVKTFGFCKTVGSKESIKKINGPDVRQQEHFLRQRVIT